MCRGCLLEVKNDGKSLTVAPKKWLRSLTGGGRLLEVPTVRLDREKFGVSDWRSLMGGGRQEVVSHGGSTVFFYLL